MFMSLQFLLVKMEFLLFRFGKRRNLWTCFCFCSYFLSLKKNSLAKFIFYRYVIVWYYTLINNEWTRLAMSSGPVSDSVKVYSKASFTNIEGRLRKEKKEPCGCTWCTKTFSHWRCKRWNALKPGTPVPSDTRQNACSSFSRTGGGQTCLAKQHCGTSHHHSISRVASHDTANVVFPSPWEHILYISGQLEETDFWADTPLPL